MKFITNEYGQRTFEYKGIKYVEYKKGYFVSEDILSQEVIENIVDDKRYLDCDKDVRYNHDIFNDKWEDSFIKKILNDKFKTNYLNNLNLEEEIRCLTKEETLNLPPNLKETSRYGYWTMSPYLATYAYVFAVSSAGYLGRWSVNIANGVRPVIKLKTKEL